MRHTHTHTTYYDVGSTLVQRGNKEGRCVLPQNHTSTYREVSAPETPTMFNGTSLYFVVKSLCVRTNAAAHLFSPPAALAKGISEVEPAAVSQNGAPPGKKSPPVPLPELEYREKGKDSTAKEREGKKQNSIGINNNSIIHTLDSKLQEAEYIENYVGGKRLNNDLAGENASHADAHSASKEDAPGAGKNYKNASGGGGNISNSSPRNHSASNGSVPPGSSAGRNEKKQKGAGKGQQKDPLENCIPNNQLGKPDALVR